MNRSRAIAAGTSVGALVLLTAGVAVANPGAHSSPPRGSNTGTGPQAPSVDRNDGSAGGDSGWWGGDDDNSRSSDGSTDPNSGFNPVQPGLGSSFDPGSGNSGSTRSGGS
jgi:hypothetical protein